MTTPAGELRAAASRLRTLADDTGPDEWWGHEDTRPLDEVPPADVALIVTMSPDLARDLAAWLEFEADRVAHGSALWAPVEAVARRVNGSA